MIKFDVHVEIIMGHFQTEAVPVGFVRLYAECMAIAHGSPLMVNVNLSKWDDKRDAQVALLHQMCSEDCVFIVVGFSHGVGYGAREFTWAMNEQGRDVHRLFSADGVYHSRLMPWRALCSPILGEPTIWFPPNVKRVDMWRQRQNKPCGHVIKVRPSWNDGVGRRVAENKIYDHGYLPYVHAAMDERTEIHRAVKDCLQSFALGS